VQVFEPEHDRSVGGEHFQGLGDLAQHSIRRDRGVALQQRRVGAVGQPGQQRQPGRRVAHENAAQRCGAGLPGQTFQRLQDRQVGFAGAVLLDAAALRPPQIGSGAVSLAERLDQRRLADARLAGDENDPALAQARVGQGAGRPSVNGLAAAP
jgi:hypothetical protein